MVFDSWRNAMLMHGGTTNVTGPAFTDTWSLDLNAPPAIATGPANTLAAVASTVTLTVGPSGPGPFAYQWRRNGTPLDDAGHYSGVHSPALTISPAAIEDSGSFDVVVTNDCGQTISNAATLVVVQPGDATGDGHVDVNDLLQVITAWGPCPQMPSTCSADVAPLGGDGIVDVNDLLQVILNWGA
jgi:hypothetical protein